MRRALRILAPAIVGILLVGLLALVSLWLAVAVMSASAVCLIARSWHDTLRLLGPRTIADVPRIFRLQRRTRRFAARSEPLEDLFQWRYGLPAVAAMLFIVLEADSVRWPLVVLIVLTALLAASEMYKPPAILLLAKSGVDAQDLHDRLRRALDPVRVVSLLEAADDDYMPDNMRTTARGDWRLMFRTLASMVALVIVDGRAASPYIEEELRWILETGLESRVLLLPAAGETPRREGTLSDVAGLDRMQTVSPADVTEAAKEWLRRRGRSRG